MATTPKTHPQPAGAPPAGSPDGPSASKSHQDDRLFELSLDLLVVAGFDGYIKRASPAWTRTLGWSNDELLARPYLEIIHPEDRERTAQEAAGLSDPAAQTRDFAIRMSDRHGGYRWILWSAKGSPDEGVFYAVGKDITERKNAERALAESEQRFRSVTESVTDAIISADADGRIIFWNRAARRMFGYELEEVEGQPLTMLMPERYREAHRRGIARLGPGAHPRLVGSTVALHGLRRDGSEFPLELSLGAWQLATRRFYSGVLRDISERRRSESYMEAQLEVSRVLAENPPLDDALPALLAAIGGCLGWTVGGFWLPDSEAGAVRCVAYWAAEGAGSAEFEAQTRAAAQGPGEGLPGRTWQTASPHWVLDVTEDDNFPRAAAATAAGLHGAVGIPILSSEEVVGVMDFFSPQLREPDDELVRMMSAISAQIGQYVRRKQAEAALGRATVELSSRAAALERSNAELEQFAYIASHDLSEPLRQVAGFVQLLSQRYRGRLDSDADEFIAFTVEGVERMQTLIDDLLAYSRVGRSGGQDGPVDAGQAFERARAALAAVIAERGAAVEVEPLPLVCGEGSELAQLFQNLLSNALKFSEQRPHVRVSAEPEGGFWRLRVDDNGIGVEPRHAERIFKMFQRLHGRGEYPGTGIGLAICKKTVERHGGEISVHPSPLGGASFQFTLPAPPPEEAGR